MSWIWIEAAVVVVLIAAVSTNKGKGNRSSGDRGAARVYHPHYVSLDDYECPRCGSRFRKDTMTCPVCGMQFTSSVTDEKEFEEEEDEELFWDDEEGW